MSLGNIAKVSFYGKKSKDYTWKARLARKEKEYQKFPTPEPYRPRLGGPSSQWKVFKTQQDAFDFARSHHQDLAVFSCESESFFDHCGQRVYLVSSYEQFWHYYRQLQIQQRHHYEVIPEGSVCCLYFDLEYPLEYNQSLQSDSLVENFIKYVNVQLKELLQIECNRKNILQLDASTCKKFSQHLIFDLPQVAFKDNIHVGHFVHQICNQLLHTIRTSANNNATDTDLPQTKKLRTDESADDISNQDQCTVPDVGVPESVLRKCGLGIQQLKEFLVKNKDGRDVLFCDTGVYTKNRNFRLYLSCKLGKNNPLLLAKKNLYKPHIPKGVTRTEEEQMFLDSLITNIQYDPDLHIINVPAPETTLCEGLSGHKRQKHDAQLDTTKNESLGGYRGSPYPEVDEHITSLLNQGGTQGAIRHWSYFSAGELLVYDIAHNRWCDNIGRQHKSNNVIYVVDLKQGVYYQKCHDPQCKADNFKSQEKPLPKSVLPSAYLEDLLEIPSAVSFDDVSDADLLLAANQLETDSNNQQNRNLATKDGGDFDQFDDDDEDLLQAAELLEGQM